MAERWQGQPRRVGPRGGARRGAVRVAVGVAVGVVVLAVAPMLRARAPDGVSGIEPLVGPAPRPTHPATVGRSGAASGEDTEVGVSTTGSTTGSTTSPTTRPLADDGAGSVPVELDDLLARYDVALAALSADPTAAIDEHHPLTLRWHDVVAAGTELDESLRRGIHDDLVERSTVVRPGAGGATFVTLALTAHRRGDGTIDFEYCGYSPGIGVHVSTGEILDDRRASTRGRGRAEPDEAGVLRLVALQDEQLRLLEPEEPDPCPALRVDARRDGAP